MGRYAAIFRLTLILLLALSTNSRAQEFNITEVEKSVVQIVIFNTKGKMIGTGSGFVVSDKGDIITNNHVVEAAGSLSFFVSGDEIKSENQKPLKLISRSPELDLALVRTDFEGLAPLPIGAAERRKGQKIFAVGYPGVATVTDRSSLAQDTTLTDGLISREFVGTWGKAPVRLIQHTAAINGGNSGGPLLDECGRVVGVNTAGPRTRLIRDNNGNVFADTQTGVFWSSAIEETKSFLEREKVDFIIANDVCDWHSGAGNSSFNFELNRTSGLAIAAGLLVLAGLVFAFSGRRSAAQPATPGPIPSGPIASRAPTAKPSRVETFDGPTIDRSRHSASAPLAPAQTGGVILSGFDRKGSKIRLVANAAQLADPYGAIIGRSHDFAHLTIDDAAISKRHARIIKVDSNFFIEDLNSANSLTVDGETMQPFQVKQLKPGSSINLAGIKLTVNPN